VGQDCILRAGFQPAPAACLQAIRAGFQPAPHSGKPQTVVAILQGRGGRIDNPPQVTNLPHNWAENVMDSSTTSIEFPFLGKLSGIGHPAAPRR
jgi:hypothetical protein